jgi:hypothetical protein
MKEIQDRVVGRVTFNGYFWEVANDVPFLGRNVVFYIDSEDKNSPDISDKQRAVFQSILNMPLDTKDVAAPAMFDNYLKVKDAVDPEPPHIDGPEDVWNHVEIVNILIPIHRSSRHEYFFIDFNCDWEEEHGLELLFRNGQLILVNQAEGLWSNAKWQQKYIDE